MAGVLAFELTADGAGFESTLVKANASTAVLKGNVLQASAAMKDFALQTNLAKLGLQLNDSGGIQDIAAPVERATNANKQLKEVTKATSEATRGLSHAMTLLGYSVAPTFTSNILAATSALKGVRAAAVVTGASLPVIGLAFVAIGGAVAIANEGLKTFRAHLAEVKSADAFNTQTEAIGKRLIPLLEKAKRLGEVDSFEAVGALNLMRDNNPEFQRKGIKQAQALLGARAEVEGKKMASVDLERFLKHSRIDLLDGPEKQKAQFSEENTRNLLQALDKAKLAGKDEQPISDLFKKIEDTVFKRIDDAAKAKSEDKTPAEPSVTRPAKTAIENIGFIFNGRGNDPARSTADNTRRMADTLNKHTAILTGILGKSSGDFANR